MLERRLIQGLIANTQLLNTRATKAASRLNPTSLRQRIGHEQQRLITCSSRLSRALQSGIITQRRALESHTKLLQSLGYRNVLNRGYAIVRNAKGQMIRQAANITDREILDIELSDGHIAAQVGEAKNSSTPRNKPDTPPKTTAQKRPRKTEKPTSGGGQGSLF